MEYVRYQFKLGNRVPDTKIREEELWAVRTLRERMGWPPKTIREGF